MSNGTAGGVIGTSTGNVSFNSSVCNGSMSTLMNQSTGSLLGSAVNVSYSNMTSAVAGIYKQCPYPGALDITSCSVYSRSI